MSIEVSINDVKFSNPTMVGAGVLGTTGSSLKRLVENGAGGVVTKSISFERKEGKKGPVLIETDYGALNSMGLPNPGAESFKEELQEISDIDVPVVCSVFGETPSETKKVIRELENLVDVFELNLSCPNVDEEIICHNEKLIEEFVSAADYATDKPLWAKLSPSLLNVSKASRVAVDSGADSIVLVNTLRGMLIDIESGRPILGNKTGGLSGKAIHPVAVENIYQCSKEIDAPIIGVGGVYCAEDAIELIMAGAKAIQVGTGLLKGLDLFKRISCGIQNFLDEKGYRKLGEIRGISHRY